VSGNASVSPPYFFCHDNFRQVLEVDLVDDAGHRRHNPEVIERSLSPMQEFVALPVALEFQLGILT
jgi:hypothetical protein